MVKSLIRYSRYFAISLLARKERKLMWRDLISFSSGKFVKTSYSAHQKKEALRLAIDWLRGAQNRHPDAGFRTYRIVEGWSGSYPETSGYILPTLLQYSLKNGHEYMTNEVLGCADWLLSIQKPSGGWQSLYMEDNRPEVVFNTAQVVRGLVEVYDRTGERKYLDAAVRGADWLCRIQEPDGSWKKHAFMNKARVYDSYVDVPLLMVYTTTNDEKYRSAAVNNLRWITQKQRSNGWFEDADNTIRHNDRPILHTLAYTLDGLVDAGLILKEDAWISSAKKSADALLLLFEKGQYLKGRFDKDWKGSEYMICTGCAQMSIVWLKLSRIFKDQRYFNAAKRMNDQLIFIQCTNNYGGRNAVGGLQGSFPLWGKYEPFAFPNWATKYFADALMLESDIEKEFKW